MSIWPMQAIVIGRNSFEHCNSILFRQLVYYDCAFTVGAAFLLRNDWTKPSKAALADFFCKLVAIHRNKTRTFYADIEYFPTFVGVIQYVINQYTGCWALPPTTSDFTVASLPSLASNGILLYTQLGITITQHSGKVSARKERAKLIA
jgi:hypothetical protein